MHPKRTSLHYQINIMRKGASPQATYPDPPKAVPRHIISPEHPMHRMQFRLKTDSIELNEPNERMALKAQAESAAFRTANEKKPLTERVL